MGAFMSRPSIGRMCGGGLKTERRDSARNTRATYLVDTGKTKGTIGLRKFDIARRYAMFINMNDRPSGADHSVNKPLRAANGSEWQRGGKIMRRSLFLILGLGMATSIDVTCGLTQTLPHEDNICVG